MHRESGGVVGGSNGKLAFLYCSAHSEVQRQKDVENDMLRVGDANGGMWVGRVAMKVCPFSSSSHLSPYPGRCGPAEAVKGAILGTVTWTILFSTLSLFCCRRVQGVVDLLNKARATTSAGDMVLCCAS